MYCIGHFTYECKDTRPYVSRPSRTAQLQNPLLVAKSSKGAPGGGQQPSVDVPDEFKNKFVLFFFFLRGQQFVDGGIALIYRNGTANRILEAKEKQREKEKEKGKTDRATKRAKRYVSFLSCDDTIFFPLLSIVSFCGPSPQLHLLNGC